MMVERAKVFPARWIVEALVPRACCQAVGTTAPQKTGAIVRFYQPLTINYQPILTLTCLRARVVSVWFEIREWKFCLVLPADPEPFRPADFACGCHSLRCLPGGGSG